MRALLLVVLLIAGCSEDESLPSAAGDKNPLLVARSELKTKLIDRGGDREPIEKPPRASLNWLITSQLLACSGVSDA